MNRYKLPNGATVKTSAARRYLLTSSLDGRGAVDSSTDDRDQASQRLAKLRREWPHATWNLVDQVTGDIN